jgi:hypothetical protein
MDDQGWPPGVSVPFALAASLVLWIGVPLVLSMTFA